MARIYVAEPGATGGVGAMGMRILIAALQRDGHDVTRIRFQRKQEDACPQLALFSQKQDEQSVTTASNLPAPDAWFVSLLNARMFWDLPDMFRRMGLALRSENRSASDPLVVFGGSAMIQPEPVADFADIIALGDGEVTGTCIATMLDAGATKSTICRELDGAKGFWLASSRSATLSRLESPLSNPWVKPGATDTTHHVIELARGCKFKCAFCPIGWAGGSYREAALESLEAPMLALRGKRVNFFAPDYSSVSYVNELEQRIAVARCSNSSRDSRIDTALQNIERGGGIKSYSFGIEGLSERMRKAVCKPISDDSILRVMLALYEAHVGVVKWFVILGLPGESDSDVSKFMDLLAETRKVYRGRLDIATTHLHALAHTPLQWIDGHYSHASDLRQAAIVEQARQWNIAGRPEGGCEMWFVNWVKQKTHDSDAYLYRAGRDASFVIEQTNSIAARIKDGRWASGVDVESVLKERDVTSPLPWDHVNVGVSKTALASAYSTYKRRIAK